MRLHTETLTEDKDYFIFYDNYWWFNIHYDQLPSQIKALSDNGIDEFDVEFRFDETYGDYYLRYHPTDTEMLELYDKKGKWVANAHVDLLSPYEHDRLKEDGVGFLDARVVIE